MLPWSYDHEAASSNNLTVNTTMLNTDKDTEAIDNRMARIPILIKLFAVFHKCHVYFEYSLVELVHFILNHPKFISRSLIDLVRNRENLNSHIELIYPCSSKSSHSNQRSLIWAFKHSQLRVCVDLRGFSHNLV